MVNLCERVWEGELIISIYPTGSSFSNKKIYLDIFIESRGIEMISGINNEEKSIILWQGGLCNYSYGKVIYSQ